jgi:hypothetical protein
MSTTILNLKRDKIPEAIAFMHRHGAGWHAPLLTAAGEGLIRFAMIPPTGRMAVSLLDMEKHRLPFIPVLNGDGYDAQGPDAFPQAIRLMRWARFMVLHGAGGQAFHYAMAVEAALIWQRVLFVECRGDHLQDWIDLKARIAPTTPGIIWKVPPGQPPHMGEMTPAAPGQVLQ